VDNTAIRIVEKSYRGNIVIKTPESHAINACNRFNAEAIRRERG
jgi:hypothetical protein